MSAQRTCPPPNHLMELVGTSLREGPPALCFPRPPVNLVRPALESLRKSPECLVEHRAHQHGKHAALEFVGDEELDIANLFADGMEIPAVLHPAERPIQIFNHYLEVRPI